MPGPGKTRLWFLRNEDTGELIEGQFPTKEVGLEVKNNWAAHTTLSRSRAILMFLNSEDDKLTFQSLFYARHRDEADGLKERFDKLLSWAKPSIAFGAPPPVTFWIGNGHLERLCVIDSISGIRYGEPTEDGNLRSVSFTVNLLDYQQFTLQDTELFETRYHRGRERDYYELLCFREYKQPMMGDIIRKRHPDQPQVTPGSIIKLPSIEAIRTQKPAPSSIALATAFGRKDTPQRALRIDTFNRRNRTYVSHIVRS
jgi:hypothetical protein